MEWLFGRKKTPAEMLRESQRALKKSMRELDRERVALERQEKKVIDDIKKSAKAGQNAVMRIQAKDLVRTRNHIKKLVLMHSQIQAVSLTIQTLKSTNTMATAMRDVTKAMGRMNRSMNMPAMQKIMQDFEREQEMMGMKQEVMDDTIDDVMGEEEDEEQADEIVNQVFDELGLSLDADLAKAPTQEYAPPQQNADADSELQERLKNLKGF
eukprot:m.203975 g.203975  ORF g.203975 m.203975 type:complete len:211 (+) comp15769_c0_seq1:159-791(+)